MLAKLLDDIEANAGCHKITIHIINDKSTISYDNVLVKLDEMFFNNYSYSESSEHCGKLNYWRLVDYLYKKARGNQFDYLVQMQDDIGLTTDFFDKAIAMYERIKDPKLACLNLMNDFTRDGKNMWTGGEVITYDDYMNTGWVDMCCFIAGGKYLDTIGCQVMPVERSWAGREGKSSGVGMQISKRLHHSGMVMYQVRKSMVIHGDHESVMHPGHRVEVPLISNHETITATMATIPARKVACEDVIYSLIPQVDEIRLYLNIFRRDLPDYMYHPKIKLVHSQLAAGDLGDTGKFYQVETISGYHFTIDDDIIYPLDYCRNMIDAIEKYKRKCVVTCHGRRFNKFPVDSYYHSRADTYKCTSKQLRDIFIQVPGTGVMAYHTDTFRFNLDMFKASNMSDIWVAIELQKAGIPIVSIARGDRWINESRKVDRGHSIYSYCHNNDQPQTKAINSIKWQLHEV
jgi:hypothetical protein